jgi:hypothetical protein
VEEQEDVKLELHPKCIENFNERGETLFKELAVIPRAPKSPPGFVPGVRVAAAFNVEEGSHYQEAMVRPQGEVMQRTFPYNGNDVGFKGDGYKNFARLCEKIQATKPLNRYISFNTIVDLVFEWMQECYIRATRYSLIDYILPKCKQAIREYEIWIPIANTYVPCNLPFERVTIQTLSQDMFNGLRNIAHEVAKTKNFPDVEKYILMLNEHQKRLQGMAAATIFVQAESRRAYEIAFEEAEKAVAILRLFSKAAFIPEVASCCVPLGQKSAQTATYFVFFEGMLVSSVNSIVGSEQTHFVIGPPQIELMNMAGISAFIRLFYKEGRNQFEEVVFNSIMIYSRGLLAISASDKLIYIFSALESLLLKNDSENIQQNVADRIAFTIENAPDKRMDVVENYKAAYDLRSKYVHHAQTVADVDTLTTFLQVVWKFYLALVHRELPKYKDKVAFLKSFDLIKYSGSMPERA